MADPTAPEFLTRSVLADQVKQWLLEAILNSSYPPDSRIVETAVAKELGISQAPVREALRGLEALGIVEITPFRGARVRRLDPEELLEAYVVRSAVEVLGARLAMQRITDDDVSEILATGELMQEAAKAGDGRAVANIDVGLHEKIMQLSGNKVLLRVWRSLEPFSRTYLTLLGPNSDPQWSADLHNPMLDAIRHGDTDHLVRAIEGHFDEVRTWLGHWLAEAAEAAEAAPGKPDAGTDDAAGR